MLLYLIAAGAFVAIWGGWVGLGELAGFGPIRLLPGLLDEFVINSALTLPLSLEAYAALALGTFLRPPAGMDRTGRLFAGWSAFGSLALGMAGQATYHLMIANQVNPTPWQIVVAVSCLPVAVLGLAAALIHLRGRATEAEQPTTPEQSVLTVGELVAEGTELPDWEPTSDTAWLDDEWQQVLQDAGDDAEPTAPDRRPLTDKDITDDAKDWARELGRPPSRDDMLERYSIGATRCRRLRCLLGWQDEPTDADPPAEPATNGRPSRLTGSAR